jgi:hypothetical protein
MVIRAVMLCGEIARGLSLSEFTFDRYFRCSTTHG